MNKKKIIGVSSERDSIFYLGTAMIYGIRPLKIAVRYEIGSDDRGIVPRHLNVVTPHLSTSWHLPEIANRVKYCAAHGKNAKGVHLYNVKTHRANKKIHLFLRGERRGDCLSPVFPGCFIGDEITFSSYWPLAPFVWIQ